MMWTHLLKARDGGRSGMNRLCAAYRPHYKVLDTMRKTGGTYEQVGEKLGLSGSEVANLFVQSRKRIHSLTISIRCGSSWG
jgi:hypothetical protein